jgi:hypothetical protein
MFIVYNLLTKCFGRYFDNLQGQNPAYSLDNRGRGNVFM